MTSPVKTPSLISALRLRYATPFGHMHVVVTVDVKTEKEMEVFAQLGKAGELTAADMEALGRLTSLHLRTGGSLKDIIKQLVGIGSNMSVSGEHPTSLPDCLGRALAKYWVAKEQFGFRAILLGEVDLEDDDTDKPIPPDLQDSQVLSRVAVKEALEKHKCAECGKALVVQDGKMCCINCNGESV